MRILSLNAWGGARFDALAAWLPSCGADLICLQEVTQTSGLGGWTTFADGERTLPQRADLFADVSDLLPHHRGHFVASDTGPITDPDGRRWQQDFGIATFAHERLRLIDAGSTFIHGSFTEHLDWWVQDRPRVAHGVRVADGEVGLTVTLVHLHGLRDPGGKGDTPARLAQAGRIVDVVSGLRGPRDEVVVCGDFNLLPDSRTFDLLAGIGLTDLVGDADTRTSWYPRSIRHASYMLVSAPSRVHRFEVIAAPEVSDHRALLLEL